MASIVDTSVKHFHSGMSGAPILNGTAGALIALLDACLVDGFDTKAATTLVVSGGVATLTFAGTHSATADSVIAVSGTSAPLTALNGDQRVTAVSPGTLKFATAAADGTATGSISFKMAPAGWAKVFTSTNKRVYQSLDVQSTKMFLRVDDSATQAARVVGYEQMTDVDTGTGLFPTTAQIAGGGHWHKSGQDSATPTMWTLASDTRSFIWSNSSMYSVNQVYLAATTRGFGDAIAYRPGGDPYACGLNYSNVVSPVSSDPGTLDNTNQFLTAFPRGHTGLGSSVLHCPVSFTGLPGYGSGCDNALGPFPSAVDGGLRLTTRWFGTAASGVPPRCELAGLYYVPMAGLFSTFKRGDKIPGTGGLTGRKLMAIPVATSSMNYASDNSNTGISFIDITGPWR